MLPATPRRFAVLPRIPLAIVATAGLLACHDSTRPDESAPPPIALSSTAATEVAAGVTAADMGLLPGGTYAAAYRINSAGQAIGTSTTAEAIRCCASLVLRAFVWSSGGGMTPVGDIDFGYLGVESHGRGLNESGTVVGFGRMYWSASPYGFIRVPGGQRLSINALPNSYEGAGTPMDVNDQGTIVGYSWTDGVPMSPYPHALRGNPGDGYADGEAREWPEQLADLPGMTSSRAYGINNAGLVVGVSGHAVTSWELHYEHLNPFVVTAEDRPVRWTAGGVEALPLLPGGTRGAAFDVNESGAIAGYSTTAEGTRHAVLWGADGSVTDLGTLPDAANSVALGLNDRGEVVGYSETPQGIRGFAWSQGTIVELPPLAGAESYAADINDSRQIVGWAGNPRSPQSFDLYWHATVWTVDFAAVAPGATPVGSAVSVNPIDQTTNAAAPVTLTFSSVTSAGMTTVTTSAQGAPPPTGFRLGFPPVYYELQTTAGYSGAITVCFTYTSTSYRKAANLRLFHDAGSGWQDVTTSNDPATGTICGTVTSLSPFILAELAYDFTGFFQPVDNPPSLNVLKAGSAVPVKFSLGGDMGLDVLAASLPTSAPISCSTSAATDAVEETVAAGASSLSYDAVTVQYVYTWKTNKQWAGTCRKLTVTLRDGSAHEALFKFSK